MQVVCIPFSFMVSDSTGVSRDPIPVLLVHGWYSHPGVWKKLCVHLDAAGIPYWKFDHTRLRRSPLPQTAACLDEYLRQMREESHWTGPVDIVCHSLGTCIARYLLEVMDGEGRTQSVRQLIGLGPPNNGSALAELFNDPHYGAEIINRLTGVFVPKGFNPATDQLVQDVRPNSPVMHSLRTAGLRTDITYRIIVTTNPGDDPAFFPLFEGKTWEIGNDGKYRPTLEGDGVVAQRESVLPGISLDVLSASPGGEGRLPEPDQVLPYQPAQKPGGYRADYAVP